MRRFPHDDASPDSISHLFGLSCALVTRPDLGSHVHHVELVTAPYLTYVLLVELGSALQPVAAAIGADVDSFSRNLVNAVVALLVGGPHMYATWTRTALDVDFFDGHRKLIFSSLVIPVIVLALALTNLQLLLTIFFF